MNNKEFIMEINKNLQDAYFYYYNNIKNKSFNPTKNHTQSKTDMNTKRRFSLSAGNGEPSAYITGDGSIVTKEFLFQAFKQVAAVFGWELEGKLTDRGHPKNSQSY